MNRNKTKDWSPAHTEFDPSRASFIFASCFYFCSCSTSSSALNTAGAFSFHNEAWEYHISPLTLFKKELLYCYILSCNVLSEKHKTAREAADVRVSEHSSGTPRQQEELDLLVFFKSSVKCNVKPNIRTSP